MKVNDKQVRDKKWNDVHNNNILDGDGLLTDYGWFLIHEYNITPEDIPFDKTIVDVIFEAIERSGDGYWYKSDMPRQDVNVRGHEADINDPTSEFFYLK